jgi:hypothetical protein
MSSNGWKLLHVCIINIKQTNVFLYIFHQVKLKLKSVFNGNLSCNHCKTFHSIIDTCSTLKHMHIVMNCVSFLCALRCHVTVL